MALGLQQVWHHLQVKMYGPAVGFCHKSEGTAGEEEEEETRVGNRRALLLDLKTSYKDNFL